LTAEEKEDPDSDTFAQAEHAALKHHLREGHDTYRHVSATSSRDHLSSIVPELLAKRLGTILDIDEETLQVTTQRGIRQLTSDLGGRFRTRQIHLHYHILQTDVYSDTLFSETKSVRGYECAQIFVASQDFAVVHPVKLKSDAPYKLDLFCKTYGLPLMLLTDNAPEDTKGEWNKVLLTDNAPEDTKGEWNKVVKQYLLQQRAVKHDSGWQSKRKCNRCPDVLWCFGLE
jgi:hypothetical protein